MLCNYKNLMEKWKICKNFILGNLISTVIMYNK